MTYHVYYDRPTRSWWGYWQDAQGNQLGDAVFAHSRDDCLLELGAVRSERLALSRS
jgi:hypothetical protein